MAKSPGPKHSRSRKEPVTIDLDPKDVERKSQAGQGAAKEQGTKPATATSENRQARSAPGPEASADKGAGEERSDRPASAESKDASGPGPARSSTGSSPAAKATQAKAAAPDRPGAASASDPAPDDAKPELAQDKKPADGPPSPKAGSGSGGSVPPSGARPASPPPSRGGSGLLAGVAGGLVALLLVAALQWAGVWPSGTAARESAELAELRLEVTELRQVLAAADPEAGELDARIAEAVEASAATLGQRIEALEQAAAAPDGEAIDLGPLQARLDELEASVATLGGGDTAEAAVQQVDGRLAELSQRLDALEAAAPDTATDAAEEQLSDISARLETLEAAGGEADDLSARLAAIEEQLASVTSELGERADEPRAALVIAASALKAAIDRGGSFEAELETYAALAPDASGVAELGAHAPSGVATRAGILTDLPQAADAMVTAGRERGEPDGFWDGLWQSARDLVSVRPVGVIEGDSVEAIVARLEAAIRDGDYGLALSEYERLPPAAQSAGADFMDRVRARHQADTLVDRALTEALRAS